MIIIATYLLLGMVAGLLAGLLGVGGGLIIVPVLVGIFLKLAFAPSVIMHMAIATSLATIVITSIASGYSHHRHGAVIWAGVRGLTPGILLGAVVGALIADYLPTESLKNIFATFEIIVAAQMAFSLRPAASRELPGGPGMSLAGMVIGSVSAIIGIGGGTLTVPFLTWCHAGIRKAVATSAVCGFPIALSAAITFVILGWGEPGLPDKSIGYVYWPAFVAISTSSLVFAPIGARLAHLLPVNVLRKVFALLLLVIGMRMLFA